MRILLLTFSLFVLSNVNAQENQYWDTLYYKSGWDRPCRIDSVAPPRLYFYAINNMGEETRKYISINQLKYYVDYDSTGTILLNKNNDITVNKRVESMREQVDSILQYNNLLSINPFSPIFLGVNFSYMYRFGENLQSAIHVPFRFTTLFGQTLVFNAGVGYNYIASFNEVNTFYVGLSGQFYVFEDNTGIGFPVIFGFMHELRPKLNFNFYAGAGPAVGSLFDFPLVFDAHIGIGIKMGKKSWVQTTK